MILCLSENDSLPPNKTIDIKYQNIKTGVPISTDFLLVNIKQQSRMHFAGKTPTHFADKEMHANMLVAQ